MLTANFSLAYPDDSDDVDIAGDLETLAVDVDDALYTRFAKAGGTLTGAVVLTDATEASSSTTGSFKTAGGMGVAKKLYVGTNLNVAGTTGLTGALSAAGATFTGDVTISKASADLVVNASSGNTNLEMRRVAGQTGYIYYRTGSSTRWTTGVSATAESGANAGSNWEVRAYDDAGSSLSTPLSITRSTGAATFSGDVTVSKAAANLQVTGSGNANILSNSTDTHADLTVRSAANGYARLNIDRAAGQFGGMFYKTGGSTRWLFAMNDDAETGSHAGSNFVLYAYGDGGSYLNTALRIARATGAATFSGDVTVSKATPYLSISATSGAAGAYVSSPAGSTADVWLRTGPTARWLIRKDNGAESGSNAGSNLVIYRMDDAGAALGEALNIVRSTGRVTVGSVGGTAGLEFGASGPRIMAGNGSPVGVVAAPVGSRWIRTDGATLGDFEYQKRSGTGSTGWVVADGDTGLRNLAAESLSNGWAVSAATFTLRRVGQLVFMTIVASKAAASPVDSVIYTLPAGFRPDAYVYPTFNLGSADDYCTGYVATSGAVLVYGSTMTGSVARLTVSFFTSDAWPTSLPGS